MAREFFRIHSATESLDTLLDPKRPDGWVASDEDLESQPHGVSCCETLEDLRRYVSYYSMGVRTGDRLVRLLGAPSYDQDRDRYAARAVVESVEVIGDAKAWLDEEVES